MTQIPGHAKILEVGCGTGQMTNFPSYAREVEPCVGSDICFNSLRLATGFRDRFAINNPHFGADESVRSVLQRAQFDFTSVIPNGVLHHTGDARLAFQSIARLLKPGGYIIIGLYNWLGRLPTLWLRSLINSAGDSAGLLTAACGKERECRPPQGLVQDQYKHPHETKHSIDEVWGWFDAADSTSSRAYRRSATPSSARMILFEPTPAGTYLDRFSTELEMLLSGGVDGGLYIMIGRKRI